MRIYPTNEKVFKHNQKVLEYYRAKGTAMAIITAQDQLVDTRRKTDKVNLQDITPTDINKTGGLPKELEQISMLIRDS